MAYIVSRPALLENIEDDVYYCMWKRQLRPYNEVSKGDTLYFYESSLKKINWIAVISKVVKLRYNNKKDLIRQLTDVFGPVDHDHPYIKSKDNTSGYSIAWKVNMSEPIEIVKPVGVNMVQSGWLRVTNEVAEKWNLDRTLSGDSVLDTFIKGNIGLKDKIMKLNSKMKGVRHERISSYVRNTIRKDTVLIKALKKHFGYMCQFPNCEVKIPKRDGGFYIEVAHIEPIHKGGKSVLGNLLVLCPNHHKELDYGKLKITKQTDKRVTGMLNGQHFEIDVSLD